MFQCFKKRRRLKIISKATPLEWIEILKKDIPIYKFLSKQDKEELHSHLKVLLYEKKFFGAHKLVVTTEMKVLICAQAALLMLHRKPKYFPNVNTIVVFESSFTSLIDENIGDGFFIKKYQTRLGESNHRTKVIALAWNSVLNGSTKYNDGHNVVLHEFAHQLDSENGLVNGVPDLPTNSAYKMWGREMTKEYKHLRDDIAHHHQSFIDEYGGTSPAEFFAVITEAFFEKPINFKKKIPQVYELLKIFYKQDPALIFSNFPQDNR